MQTGYNTNDAIIPGFLKGEGEMIRLTRELDWSATSIGSFEHWPQSLRTTLSIILTSRFPMFLFWGPEQICFYNDAYRPSLGNDGKHPDCIGKPGAQVWPEIWDFIKPIIDQVLSGGEASWNEDQLLPIYRNGRMEDVYWTFSYSPVNDETDKPYGVFVTCSETTQKVVHFRQLEESKDQLNFAIQAAELGTWDLDPMTNMFTGNDRLKQWFGLAPEDRIDLSLALEVIAEHDRQKVVDSIQYALQYVSGGQYDVQYTIVNPLTQQEIIVHAKGKAVFNQEQIAYRFNGTLEDITEEARSKKELKESESRFRQAAQQLQDKNSELTRINNDLDNFIYTASHDLKAPISNLEGLLHAFEGDNVFDEEQRELLDMMFHSIERFRTTIEDLTEISKLQRVDENDVQTIFFQEFLSEVTLDIRELMVSFNPFIETEFNVDHIRYSRKNLRSIMYNLLSNALKYSSPERRPMIRITTFREKDCVVFKISDNGLGLSKDNQSKIFGMFSRIHQHVEGSGVGLYIIKRMIENSGGSIELESELGKGTTFTVYLHGA